MYSLRVTKDQMPGAEWCPVVHLNHADQILRHAETRPAELALVLLSETFGERV